MMTNLLKRGELIASARQRRKLNTLAQRLREIFGSAAVDVEGDRVRVSGRGIVKRWLVDPRVRFLDGERP
jgi:hypothetical protein